MLEVRFRPTGVARVDLRVERDAAGSVVTMEETPTGGALSHVPNALVDPLLAIRNALSLRRLRREVERGAGICREIGAATRTRISEPRRA